MSGMVYVAQRSSLFYFWYFVEARARSQTILALCGQNACELFEYKHTNTQKPQPPPPPTIDTILFTLPHP